MNFELEKALLSAQADFHNVVPFNIKTDKLATIDLSKHNKEINRETYSTTAALQNYIDFKQKQAAATYLIGGYREHREIYRRSSLFDKNIATAVEVLEEPRSIHLGIDIWAPAGTPVFAPLGGMVHSFANNADHGDYGATIILQHQLHTFNFYTLYGHLSLRNLEGMRKGRFITRGETFAHFGPPAENGNWPPHLHFQLITDMLQYEGDFPGVCKPSEAGKYISICLNPDIILNMQRFL